MTDHAGTIRLDAYGKIARNQSWEQLYELAVALLAERQQLQEERDAAFDAVGLPHTASLDDLIRHHRNNAGMAASGHKIAAEEWEKRAVKAEAERQQAQGEAEAMEAEYECMKIDVRMACEQRQQAIDALRDAKHCAERGDNRTVIAVVDAALVKLGETR